MIKRNPRDRKPSRMRKMPPADTWHIARKSEYGRMVEPAEIIADMVRAAKVRMADQEPVE